MHRHRKSSAITSLARARIQRGTATGAATHACGEQNRHRSFKVANASITADLAVAQSRVKTAEFFWLAMHLDTRPPTHVSQEPQSSPVVSHCPRMYPIAKELLSHLDHMPSG